MNSLVVLAIKTKGAHFLLKLRCLEKTKTMEDRLEQFVKDLKDQINSNYDIIKGIFNQEYGYPELDPLRDEICKCIICGFNQAAITLTNHLLESSLKKCLAMRFSIENKKENVELEDAFKGGIDEYDDKLLEDTINRACSQGLITKEQKIVFKKFKDDFRNPYSHASTNKIFKDLKVKGSVVVMSEREKENPEEFIKRLFQTETEEYLTIKDILPIQGMAQVIVAKESIIPYFSQVDETIREMLKKLKPNIKTT